MTENEHTPSPWFVVSGRYIYHQHINELDNPDDIEVARVSHPRDLPVIAAAPDLLSACEEMFGYLCENIPAQQPSGWEHEMLESARAAIAKALGRDDVPDDA